MITNHDVDEELQRLRQEALIDVLEETLLYDHERLRGEIDSTFTVPHRQPGDRVGGMAFELRERIDNLARKAASAM